MEYFIYEAAAKLTSVIAQTVDVTTLIERLFWVDVLSIVISGIALISFLLISLIVVYLGNDIWTN